MANNQIHSRQSMTMSSSPVKGPILQPPIISSRPPPFMNNQQKRVQQTPKPMIMTPTTRFNTNPNVLIFDQQNGGRISKPLMEKRRRARINQCLSQLKTIVVDSARQFTQNNKCKLEKADILELTVNYVKKLHQQQEEPKEDDHNNQYVLGYSECAHQFCEYLATLSNVPEEQKQSIRDYLQQRLMVLQQQNMNSSPTAFNTPPSPAPSSESSNGVSTSNSNSPDTTTQIVHSPVESLQLSTMNKTKRTFGSDFEEMTDYEDDDDEEFDDIYSHSNIPGHHRMILHGNNENYPLNLKVNLSAGTEVDDDVWRPW